MKNATEEARDPPYRRAPNSLAQWARLAELVDRHVAIVDAATEAHEAMASAVKA